MPAPRAIPFAVLPALAQLTSALALAQTPGAPLDLATFPRTSLEITHRGAHRAVRKFPFDVWVADTPERAQQGLMFVSDLPEGRGMVFPLESPRVETMWMKNTYIELDMLFIGAQGRVTKIIERAQPMSMTMLSSDTPVSGVLELKGGEVAKLGLKVGDTVAWKKPTP
ncbi:MAG: DUF192 domain-containing protein [Gammaproteobacteria bacterium]|nr:MAG: DUF192 domain-containing protein [Gammaproteobacteria bacterium]TLY70017.1 MAG: DUF192 domain-containing protein [Gammaproteobacteria bacterium]